MATATQDVNLMLAEEISNFYADPYGFTLFAYPWNQPGELEHEDGPDDNQREFLEALGKLVEERGFDGISPVMPILMNETSGHGTGKSAMGAWIADWILSTRPFSMGTVTAGTYQQLESRTWAAIRRWTNLCITKDWFDIRATGIYHKVHPSDWKVVIQSCKEENAQAFAGQHAKNSTSWYLFDEASEVPDRVFEVAYGGLTDGEPMMFAWGQPVRNTGEFYRICFGNLAERWNTRRVDSRNSRFTNKELISRWIQDYGEDSDFVRVRVFGLPPTASELQFIDSERVELAKKRKVTPLTDEPLICGLDMSDGGSAWTVFAFRRGQDATMPRIRIPGQLSRDRDMIIAKAADLLSDKRPDKVVSALFVDSAFGSPIVERLHVLGFNNVHEVRFGGESPDFHQLNMRAYMWNQAKEWLLNGALPDDRNLAEPHRLGMQLTRPGYKRNTASKLVLESKESIVERGESSPDDADAFVLTFARRVAVRKPVTQMSRTKVSAWG